MGMRMMLVAAAIALPTVAMAQEKYEGYTCCNLHYDKDWISDANWGNQPMIPAGAKIKVIDYGWNRASVEIEGKPFRIGQDYGRKEEPLDKYIGKLVVKQDPNGRIEHFPAKVKAAIREGKVIPGMTHDQVVMAVGYPPTHRTPVMESTVWHHWASRAGRYEVHWKDGKVDRVVGAPW
jgi:hypothetical protein